MDRKELGARIAALRTARELTQSQLATLAGVPLATLKNWEHGTREPLARAVAALARALRVSTDELLGFNLEDHPEQPPPPRPPRGRPPIYPPYLGKREPPPP